MFNLFKKNVTPRQSRQRSWVSGWILLTIMLVVIGWLGFVFARTAITKEADGQSLSKDAQKLYQQANYVAAKRGTIYDSVGNVIAENTTTYTVAVVVSSKSGANEYAKQSDYSRIAKDFATVLGKTPDYYENYFKKANKNTYQVEFGNVGANLSSAKYEKLKSYNLPGVTFSTGTDRFYPNGVFASHLIGLAQTKVVNGRTTLAGTMGIEAAYNSKLNGKDGSTITSSDPTMKAANKAVKNGDDIYTTLNSTLQIALETKMDELVKAENPKSAIAVVMDTKTGNLVAVSQRPSFNATTGSDLGSYWTNLLTEDQYEPGSVMKGITLASAIATNNWNANATYKSGTLEIDDQKITDWNNGKGWGTISYADGLALSSNVAFSLTEQKMGATTWGKYIKAFNFLKSTNSGLSGEQAGTYQFKYPIEQANTAFGQGISVTPIQMIQAYSAIAGNGDLLKPNLIEKIVDPNTHKVVYQSKRTKVGKPISSAVAKETRVQLENVLYSDRSINKSFALTDTVTAGKSGTAQIATSSGYSQPGDTANEIFSWMGMAPADNPRYLMYIVTKQPQTNADKINDYQSDMFKSIMEQALAMSDNDNKITISADQERKVPTTVGEDQAQAQKDVTAAGLKPILMGSGSTIKSQSPIGDTEVLSGQRVFLNTGSGVEVPNMQGWTKNDAMAWGKLAGVDIVIHGDGFVATQSVNIGTKLSSGVNSISLELKKPTD